MRVNLSLARVEESMRLLEENIESLNNYLKENITSNSAALIIEEVQNAELVLSDPSSLIEIEKINIKLLDLLFSLFLCIIFVLRQVHFFKIKRRSL